MKQKKDKQFLTEENDSQRASHRDQKYNGQDRYMIYGGRNEHNGLNPELRTR